MTTASGRAFSARPLTSGRALGRALVLAEPLSFWGGIDPSTGAVIDVHHPQVGSSVAGRVLVMPSGRGSSSSSIVAEAIRAGTAPAAIVLARADDIVVLGAVVARELYGREHPIVVLDRGAFAVIQTGDLVLVEAVGEVASVRLTPSG